MRKMRMCIAIGMIMILAASMAAGTHMTTTKPHLVALIVQNHAERGVMIPMVALTDALTAKLTGKTFQVINPYNAVGKTENRTVAGEPLPEMSAFELAQALGAEGVITVTAISLLDKKIGRPTDSRQHVIRLTINFADASTGANICGETIKVESPRYKITDDVGTLVDQLKDLMYSAAYQCAELLEKKAAGWRPEPPPKPPVVASPPPAKKTDLGVIALTPKRAPKDRLRQTTEPQNEDFTIFDFESMFKSLTKAMFDNARFHESYHETQTEKTDRPIVIIGAVTNKSAGAFSQSYGEFLAAMPDTLRTEFGDYRIGGERFFDAKDDDMSRAFAERILASDKSPLEDAVLMEALKQHGSPNFVVVGDIRLFPGPGKKKTCRFHLVLHSLYTGKIIWEGLVTAIK